jgi:hypothetical protein
VAKQIEYTKSKGLGGVGMGDKSPKSAEKKKKQKDAKKADVGKKK